MIALLIYFPFLVDLRLDYRLPEKSMLIDGCSSGQLAINAGVSLYINDLLMPGVFVIALLRRDTVLRASG